MLNQCCNYAVGDTVVVVLAAIMSLCRNHSQTSECYSAAVIVFLAAAYLGAYLSHTRSGGCLVIASAARTHRGLLSSDTVKVAGQKRTVACSQLSDSDALASGPVNSPVMRVSQVSYMALWQGTTAACRMYWSGIHEGTQTELTLTWVQVHMSLHALPRLALYCKQCYITWTLHFVRMGLRGNYWHQNLSGIRFCCIHVEK